MIRATTIYTNKCWYVQINGVGVSIVIQFHVSSKRQAARAAKYLNAMLGMSRAEALREAADEFPAWLDEPTEARSWLRSRADAIEKGE